MKKKKSKRNNIRTTKVSSDKNKFINITTNIKPTKSQEISKGIPKYVADRMAKRIIITAGIPTILGMSVFVISYFIVTKNIA